MRPPSIICRLAYASNPEKKCAKSRLTVPTDDKVFSEMGGVSDGGSARQMQMRKQSCMMMVLFFLIYTTGAAKSLIKHTFGYFLFFILTQPSYHHVNHTRHSI